MSVSAEPAAKAGDLLTVDLEAMVHGGVCLAHLPDGAVMFVDGGIPGERVVAELSYRRRKVWFARVVEVLSPSPHRRDAPCPYVGTCGGCQLQHIEYDHQLELKRAIVEDAMARQKVTLPPEVTLSASPSEFRYRWRGEFHVVSGAAGMHDAELGFNRVRSWKPVAVDDCLIHHERIATALPALREAVRRGATPQLGVVHLTVGEQGQELMVRGKPESALNSDVVDSVAAEYDELWAREFTTLRWRGRTFRVTPDSFIQVNWDALDVLYGLVLGRLGDVAGKRVVDGYAGIGVMSCVIAEEAAEVICIESNRAACAMGVLNAEMNEVAHRVRYVAESVEDALAGVCGDGTVDTVILDPPRAGCESRVTGFLALAGPGQIIYVSCDPATLARDLRILVTSGPYTFESLDIVDMFPQTHHVECVATLSRQQA